MLATQADVEARLQVTFDQDPEPVITALLEAATGLIQDYCDQHFEAQDGLQVTLDGSGAAWLFVPEGPIRAVTSVVEDGRTLTWPTEFVWYRHGSLYRRRPGRWTGKPQAVAVTYDAGYETIPEGLKSICAGIVARAFRLAVASLGPGDSQQIGAVESEGIGSYSISYAVDALSSVTVALSDYVMLTADDRRALDPYRREVIG